MLRKLLFRTAWMPGIALLALTSNAGAATIVDYSTMSSHFAGGGDVINSSGGVMATLTFTPNTTTGAQVPSNIDLGDFQLVCAACSVATPTSFGPFTFDLMVDDTTDNALGEFIGTSTGGTVTAMESTVQVNWQPPLMFGPGSTGATSGNFGFTSFDLVTATTLIVAPNSGTPPGDTTVQGQVASSTPEPTTFALIGGALFSLGMAGRRKASRNA